jgi:hypothetical protein
LLLLIAESSLLGIWSMRLTSICIGKIKIEAIPVWIPAIFRDDISFEDLWEILIYA